MKKSILYSMVFAFAVVGLASTVVMAADAGPAEMTLQTAEAKKPAKFAHKKHQDAMKCGECHHGKDAAGKQAPYTDGMKIEKCGSCHTESMANAKLNSYKNAAHENCKGCHTKMEGEGKKTGPTKCDGCHVKS